MRLATRMVGALALPVVRACGTFTGSHGLTLVGWHRIGSSADGLTTSLADFRRHLDVLDEWGATVLPLTEAYERMVTDDLPDRAVALTFDDGYASVIEQAWPELRARGLPATLFAVTGYLDGRRRFPWDERHPGDSDLVRLATAEDLVRARHEGLDVGSHTVTHRWLPRLTSREVAEEVRRSRDDLEDLLGTPIRSFAYPMGGWTAQIRDEVERAGYDVALTVDRGRNLRDQDPVSLRRAFAFDRPTDLRRQLEGAFTWMRPIENRRRRREPAW